MLLFKTVTFDIPKSVCVVFFAHSFPSRELIFISFSSLLVGFYFEENSAGGGKADFNNTWEYVEVLKESFFVIPSLFRSVTSIIKLIQVASIKLSFLYLEGAL